MKLISTVLVTSFVLLGSSITSSFAQNTRQEFAVKNSSDYKIEEKKHTQSNIVLSLKFISENSSNDVIDQRYCQIQFQFTAKNNNLTQEKINEFTESEVRKKQIKNIVDSFAKVSNQSVISLQKYKGHELVIELEQNTGNENLKGIMVMVETPKGRMTQTCMNLKSRYDDNDLNDFRSVTQNIIMPE